MKYLVAGLLLLALAMFGTWVLCKTKLITSDDGDAATIAVTALLYIVGIACVLKAIFGPH